VVSRANSLWGLLFLLLLGGCGESTIRVLIYREFKTSDNTHSTRIQVHRGSSAKHDETKPTSTVSLPNTLLLENGEPDSTEKILVTVDLLINGTVEVTRKARLDFDPDRDVILPMPVCASCKGIVCEEKQTCIKGSCQSYVVKEENLPEDEGRDNWDTGECTGGGGGGGPTICTGKCDDANCGECLTDTWIVLDYLEVEKQGITFRIAAGEVTQKQFAYWQDTNPQPADVHADCVGAPVAPDDGCLSGPSVCKGAGCENHPQVCVSWCAAEAYCRWAGKRLCGDYQQLGVNEWEVACWGAAMSELPYGDHYPYGQGYQTGICNGKDNALGTTVATRSLTQCSGGLTSDLRDMSGNVSEWTADKSYRGGHFDSPGNQMHCSSRFSDSQGTASPTIGFRCCSDL